MSTRGWLSITVAQFYAFPSRDFFLRSARIRRGRSASENDDRLRRFVFDNKKVER
jgi:hypothetical protein